MAEFFLPIKQSHTEPFVFGIIFLFTAISIIVAYFVDRPKRNND